MAKSPLQIEIEGLKELQAKSVQLVADLHGRDIADAMRDSVIKLHRRVVQPPPGGYVQGAKVGYIPVDQGQLRASMTQFITVHGPVVQGGVGTNQMKGVWGEFGTKPHWPPIAALEVWARRHHTSAFLVARAISKKGTKALKFMKASMNDNREWIQRRFDRAIDAIVKRRPK